MCVFASVCVCVCVWSVQEMNCITGLEFVKGITEAAPSRGLLLKP